MFYRYDNKWFINNKNSYYGKYDMICGWCSKLIVNVTYYCRRCGFHLGYDCLKNGKCPQCSGCVERH